MASAPTISPLRESLAWGGADFTIGPDYTEVGSLIGLAAATGSRIRIDNARPHEHRMTAIMFGRLGVRWDVDGDAIVVPAEQELTVVPDFGGAVPTIGDMPWPGFPPDLMSIAVVLATQSEGTVLIHEKMFEGRMVFTDRLIAMGARIIPCDPFRAVVIGRSELRGEKPSLPRHPRRHGPRHRRPRRPRREHHPQRRPNRPRLRTSGTTPGRPRRPH